MSRAESILQRTRDLPEPLAWLFALDCARSAAAAQCSQEAKCYIERLTLLFRDGSRSAKAADDFSRYYYQALCAMSSDAPICNDMERAGLDAISACFAGDPVSAASSAIDAARFRDQFSGGDAHEDNEFQWLEERLYMYEAKS